MIELFSVHEGPNRIDIHAVLPHGELDGVPSPTTARLVSFFRTAAGIEVDPKIGAYEISTGGIIVPRCLETKITACDVDEATKRAKVFLENNGQDVGYDVDDENMKKIPPKMLNGLPSHIADTIELALLPKRPEYPGQYL